MRRSPADLRSRTRASCPSKNTAAQSEMAPCPPNKSSRPTPKDSAKETMPHRTAPIPISLCAATSLVSANLLPQIPFVKRFRNRQQRLAQREKRDPQKQQCHPSLCEHQNVFEKRLPKHRGPRRLAQTRRAPKFSIVFLN